MEGLYKASGVEVTKKFAFYLNADEYRKMKRFLASQGITCSEWFRKKVKLLCRFIDCKERHEEKK